MNSAPPYPLGSFESPRELPFCELDSWTAFQPSSGEGAGKYRAPLERGIDLEALLVNKGSDVLVVSLHGSTDRKRFELPRFEWFRHVRNYAYSSLYFSDPTIRLGERFQLGWYTGWGDLDLYPVLAAWASAAAEAVGARHIVFFGGSGGGLASLQAATFLPGSLAVAFSPQTHIAAYYQAKDALYPQRSYVRHAMPHLEPVGGLKRDHDWSVPLGERASALRRYEVPRANYVLYVQNENDAAHFQQHYLPFRAVAENGPNRDRIRFHLHPGPQGHHPASPGLLRRSLEMGVGWLRELDVPDRSGEGSTADSGLSSRS